MRPELSWIERYPPKIEATRSNRVGRANELNNLDQQRPSSPSLSNHIAITETHFSVARALVILKVAETVWRASE